MGGAVTYGLEGGVATVVMDDGKVNALSPAMLGELGSALDRAEGDGAAVVLRGRPGTFSGGFDLRVLRGGGPDAVAMLRAGFLLARRLLAFPAPVVVACTGHAVAMGSFLVLSADHRVGMTGPFTITANEVAIGLTMPHAAVELCRDRLAPAAFIRAVALAEVFSPEAALAAGYLDTVADPDTFDATVADLATRLAALDRRAHAATKRRARAELLERLERATERDDAELAVIFG